MYEMFLAFPRQNSPFRTWKPPFIDYLNINFIQLCDETYLIQFES